MSRYPFQGGQVWDGAGLGVPEGEVDIRRRALAAQGLAEDARLVVAELTLSKLVAIYDRMKSEYGVQLQASRDLEELKVLLCLTVGSYVDQHSPDLKEEHKKKLRSALAAMETLLEIVSPMVGFVDIRQLAAALLIVKGLTDLNVDAEAEDDQARMAALRAALHPLLNATRRAVSEFEIQKPKRGRPPDSWQDVFYGGLVSFLRRAGVDVGLHHPPSETRPGPLFALTSSLEEFLPPVLRAGTIETRSQRILKAKRRRKPRGKKSASVEGNCWYLRPSD